MRNARWVVLAVALLTVAAAVALAERALSPPKYKFEIVRTPSGIELECQHGCYWKSLVGNCDDEFPNCTYVIDDRGIRVFPDTEGPKSSEPGSSRE